MPSPDVIVAGVTQPLIAGFFDQRLVGEDGMALDQNIGGRAHGIESWLQRRRTVHRALPANVLAGLPPLEPALLCSQ